MTINTTNFVKSGMVICRLATLVCILLVHSGILAIEKNKWQTGDSIIYTSILDVCTPDYLQGIYMLDSDVLPLSELTESYQYSESIINSTNNNNNNFNGQWTDVTTTQNFSGGSGTKDDPWLIANPQDLNNIRSYLGASHSDKYFKQTADIDLGVLPWNENEGWMPIGGVGNTFSGHLDGNGFVISNLYINRPASSGVALFGWANGATFTNIGLKNVNITGNERVSALLGRIDNGQVDQCYSTGIVRGKNFTGGLVANLYFNSVIDKSFSHTNIEVLGSNTQQFGGLVARLLTSHVSNSFATGKVKGLTWTGGLIGVSTDNSTITNCYSSAMVEGGNYSGGLVGEISATVVTNSYSSSRVIANLSGGLFGRVIGEVVTIINSYWNIETSGQNTSAGGIPKTISEMILQTTFEGWDFGQTWKMTAGESFPFLQFQSAPGTYNYPPVLLPPSNLTASYGDTTITLQWLAPSTGAPAAFNIYRNEEFIETVGSDITRYVDHTVENYIYYRYYITSVIGELESDPSKSVNLFATPGFSEGNGTVVNPYHVSNAGELFTVRLFLSSHFIQIAPIDLAESPWAAGNGWKPIGEGSSGFFGSYNGNGFPIKNLYINRPSTGTMGLFSYANQAVIENVILENVDISSWSRAGGIAGTISNTKINNSFVSGRINSFFNLAGGISGVALNGSNISRSASVATVFATGSMAGGIVGALETNSNIFDSYASGNIIAFNNAGGISGSLDETSKITNSYSIAVVKSDLIAGGLVGTSIDSSNVINSFWNLQTSEQAFSSGGTGLRTLQMIRQTSYMDWDFDESWRILEKVSFPYFKWQPEPVSENLPTGVFQVTFNVNMVPATNFNPVADIIYITGDLYSEWPEPGVDPENQTMTQLDDSMIWTITLPLEKKEYQYKYFKNNGWNGSEWEGEENRQIKISGNTVINNVWGSNENIVGSPTEPKLQIESILVFPNPVREVLSIELDDVKNGSRVVLYNLMGQLLEQHIINQSGRFSLNIDFRPFDSGIYVLQILDPNNQSSIRKITKY